MTSKYYNINYETIISDENLSFDHRYERIRLGLCCINNTLRDKGIFCSRTTPRSHFTVERAKEMTIKNIRDIVPLVRWNYQNRIYCLRLSSDILPHYTDTETEPYTMEFADEDFKRSGEICKAYEQKITMHPGQYNQVGTKTPETFEKTVKELDMHAEILERMGVSEKEGILIVHGGGTYGDKERTKRRWIEQFAELPRRVRKRLAIENCEKGYSVRDCLDIATEVGIPVIFDSHHYDCYFHFHKDESQESPEDLMQEVVDTWSNRKRMVTHVSNQKPDAPVGAHSDYIDKLPKYFLDVPHLYNKDIHIEVEAKAKEAAIIDLYNKYPEIFIPKLY
jgi:UV DNA damage endonuclease